MTDGAVGEQKRLRLIWILGAILALPVAIVVVGLLIPFGIPFAWAVVVIMIALWGRSRWVRGERMRVMTPLVEYPCAGPVRYQAQTRSDGGGGGQWEA